MKRSLPFIIIAVVLVGGLVTFFALSRKRGGNTNNTFVGAAPQTPAINTTSSPPPQASQASPTNSAGLTKPNVKISSPVLLEEYGDYQCPPCGALYPDLRKIE